MQTYHDPATESTELEKLATDSSKAEDTSHQYAVVIPPHLQQGKRSSVPTPIRKSCLHKAIHTSDYVDPLSNIRAGVAAGIAKAESTINASTAWRVLLKAAMSGAYLGMAMTLCSQAVAAGWDKVSAGMLFPFGFIMLILMGNDLATGNFALLPMASIATRHTNKSDESDESAKQVSLLMIAVNWTIVYTGNFIGAMLYLFILWGGMTHFGQRDPAQYEEFTSALCAAASHKVVIYYETGGAAGWFASLFNGVLCNWLVTMAVLLSFASRSAIGKMVAMYIPIAIFICIGFEHSIVNLFLLPAGLAYHCDTYNAAQWWLWNQIPVTMGNMIGGVAFTAIVYMLIWAHKLH